MKCLGLFLLLASSFFGQTFQELKDEFSLPLLNPLLQHRKTAKIKLENGMEAYLISDPNAKESAIAVTVEAGSWQDPKNQQGMAHFLEHMVFQGTENLPGKNSCTQFISDRGGKFNAHTAGDYTGFFFSIPEKHFPEAMTILASQLSKPLFNLDCIQKERGVVHQEFMNGKDSDSRRWFYVFGETSNAKHPIHEFSCGSNETLASIDTPTIKKWFEENYSANLMKLVAYSSLSLEELKSQITQIFSVIPNREYERPKVLVSISEEANLDTVTYVEPLKNQKTLSLAWELPKSYANDLQKPFDLIAYVLNRGQNHNLLELLKLKALGEEVQAGITTLGKDFPFFFIEVTLTEKGVKDYLEVVELVFQTLAGLKKQEIPLYLWEEKESLAKLDYQYQNQKEAFNFIMGQGVSLREEDFSTYPKYTLFSEKPSPESLQTALQELIPEDFRIFLTAPAALTKVPYEKEEKWTHCKYSVKAIPQSFLKKWKSLSAHPEIHLPSPNPFVPTDLRVLSCENGQPISLVDNEFGKVFYKGDLKYKTPQVCYFLQILSPKITPQATSQVNTDLFLYHLSHKLDSTLQNAHKAGLITSLQSDGLGVNIKISGFSEKAPLLLEIILKECKSNPPTKTQFQGYVEALSALYENANKGLAYKQGRAFLEDSFQEQKVLASEKNKALEKISYEDYVSFYQTLFEKAYVKALFSGNLTSKEAEGLWVDVHYLLQSAPYPSTEHYLLSPICLKEGPYYSHHKVTSMGNAAFLLIEGGKQNNETEVSFSVLNSLLQEGFFHTLRTEQKTAYLARAEKINWERTYFELLGVQSSTHEPMDLLYRFELFLEDFLENFSQKVPRERFEAVKGSILHQYQNMHQNLYEEASLYYRLAFHYEGDFSLIENRIQVLEKLTYDDFYLFCKKFLSRSNKKRFALLLEGKSPFQYRPVFGEDLAKITYLDKEEKDSLSSSFK